MKKTILKTITKTSAYFLLFAALILAAAAEESPSINIASPLGGQYNLSNVLLNGSTSLQVDEISYNLDNSSYSLLCNNCSYFSKTLENLSDGTHVVGVLAVLNQTNHTASRSFSVNTSVPIEQLELTVSSPVNATYSNNNVTLNFAANHNANISYKLDGNSFIDVCSNCVNFISTLYNVSNGVHDLKLKAIDNNNQFAQVDRQFTINFTQPIANQTNITEPLVLTVASPLNQTYTTRNISLSATTNHLANISYKLGIRDRVLVCSNCTSFNYVFIGLSNGVHDLRVFAKDNSTQVEILRRFYVNATKEPETPRNYTKRNFTGEYARGFEKLPKDFASGNVTNAELIEIMQANKLNPGVLNRLIKTGKLSQEAIDVMIETQFMPPGIMHKLFGWFGWGGNDLVEELMKHYNLTESQIQELINKQPLPRATLQKLIRKRTLSEESIELLIERINETKNHKILEDLAKYQTLTPENVNAMLNVNGFKPKVVKNLVKYQVLDNETVSELINWTKDKSLRKDIEKNQITERDRIQERIEKANEKANDSVQQIREKAQERIENIQEKRAATVERIRGNNNRGNGKKD